ncbi:hypothetical protein GCM10010149_68550 [Nonomuraea roseoviolacea subsp. roseoviolacea]
MNGRVVYSNPSKPSAESIAKRYEGGQVREKGKAQQAGTS